MMDKCKDRFFLRAVVSRDATRGGNFARSRQVEIFSSDYDAILEDTAIDLVVLATRHNEHAQQVIRGLEAGKHVFVEKPLAISWDELDACVIRSLPRRGAAPMVGFNRLFLALQMLKQELVRPHSAHDQLSSERRLHSTCALRTVPKAAAQHRRSVSYVRLLPPLTGAPVASISATSSSRRPRLQAQRQFLRHGSL
jgi:hypothetical protein